MASIGLKRIEKIYPGGVHAVRTLDLEVNDGELLVLVGPSGCGKSTVLRLVAGLESLTSGEILLDGERVDRLPARERDIAMVFQSYALYGHMTVRQNLEFPLRMRGMARPDRRGKAERIAGLLELERHLDARPAELSGGQQQRVAMGRALVREPRAFLLDEPLSNLDARLRASVRTHIAELQARLGVTTLYVTHDQVEALSLGHRVAVLRDGRLQQVGPGQELYDRPANTFVAQFLGQPPMNLLEGRLVADGDGGRWRVDVGPATLPLHDSSELQRALAGRSHAELIVGIRPEALELTRPEAPSIPAEVRAVETLGPERIVHVDASVRTVDAGLVEGRQPGTDPGHSSLSVRTASADEAPAPGARVGLKAAPGDLRLFDREGCALRV